MTDRARVSAVIFDCDGVLVDSEHLVTVIESEMLAPLGVVLDPAAIAERFVGLSDTEMHRRIEVEWGITLPADFATRKLAAVYEAFDDRLEPVAGIVDVVTRVRVPKCVASSSQPDRLARSLARTGLAVHFGPHVLSAVEVRRGKPAPDLFLLAAQRLAIGPSACIVVEDSPHGVTAGVAAGMRVIGFVAGRHATDALPGRLRDAGAHDVARTSADLAALLAAAGATSGLDRAG